MLGHIPFIVNLASKDNIIRDKSVKRLSQEIIRANAYGINILVLHPGSTLDGDTNRGIACIIKAMDDVYDLCKEYNVMLALETMSGQGTQIGSSFEELAYILQGVKNNSHLAVCLDTCHLYAAGYQRDIFKPLFDDISFDEDFDRVNYAKLIRTKD